MIAQGISFVLQNSFVPMFAIAVVTTIVTLRSRFSAVITTRPATPA